MSYCTNDECPHKKRTGKPAEFLEEITVCSDCGSTLSNIPPVIIEHQEAQSNSEIVKRALFTLGMLTAWYLLSLIRLPYLDFSNSHFEDSMKYFFGGGRFTIMALGIMPYISAYILIEIASLIISPLKKWRKEGYEGRRKLRLTAFQTTLLIAPLQGLEIATSLESMAGGIFVQNPGLGFRLIVSITLTAATFLTIWLTDLITRRGIGHGISILLLSGILIRYAKDFRNLPTNDLKPFFLLLIPFALIVLITKVERSFIKIPVKYNNGITSFIPLRLNAAGVVPLTIGLSLVSIPLTPLIFIFEDPTIIPTLFEPGKASYYVLYVLTAVIFYPVFSLLFYNPKRIVSFLSDRNASVLTPKGIKDVDYIGRNLKLMALGGVIYLCLVALLPNILTLVPDLPVVFGGINFIIMVSVALDVINELRARRTSGNLIKVHESHDVPKAGLMKNLLEKHDIQCHLKGYYHRALLYFFGPHIEISVLVPESKVDEANEIIAQYFEPVTASSE